MEALFSLGKADASAGVGNRDINSSNIVAGPSSFSATLAAQDAAESKSGQSSEQAVTAPAERAQTKEGKLKQAKASDADSPDDESEADKAAAAAATLAQMLAAPAPAPAPLALGLSGESPESLPSEDAPAVTSQPANAPASAEQATVSAVATQADGPIGAGQSAGAAFASLIEANTKSQTPISTASAEPDSLPGSTEAKPPAPTPPGLSSLPLFANPLRAAALATAIEAGQQAGLQSAVGSHEWAEELGTRLAVMTAQGDQSGSLRLSPEHLGPLEVQIRMQDDKANVVFGAQHADTRRALEEALPRLRELFAASGLQLGDAGVSREAPRQAQTGWSTRSVGGLPGLDTDVSAPVADAQRRYHLGLLDTVA